MTPKSSLLVQFVPLSMSMFLMLIVHSILQLHTAEAFSTSRPKLPPLNVSVCTQFCHKYCEQFRYQIEIYEEDWGTRGLPHWVTRDRPNFGSEKVAECEDAKRRCDCGPKPDTFLQSHCNEYCWEECSQFDRGSGYGLEKVDECIVAQSRCICSPNLKDVYREPTKQECEQLCHKKCSFNGESYDDYRFCLNAKPKCHSCGMNPAIGWIFGLLLLFCFGFLSCYGCQRAGADGRSGATNVNLTPHSQIRGGGFLPVIPPTPVRPLTPVRPYEPQLMPRNPSPSLDPVRQTLIPVYPEPSAPALPESLDNDLPPSYDDVIKKY